MGLIMFGIVIVSTFTINASYNRFLAFQNDPKNTGFTEGKLTGELELLWKYEVECSINSIPAVVDGKVYLGVHELVGRGVYCPNVDASWYTLGSLQS